MICPGCGKEVRNDQLFCTNCGTDLRQQNTTLYNGASGDQNNYAYTQNNMMYGNDYGSYEDNQEELEKAFIGNNAGEMHPKIKSNFAVSGWSALFGLYYMIYRKQYAWGFGLLILNLIAVSISSKFSNFLSLLIWLFAVFGFYAVYRKSVDKNITEIESEYRGYSNWQKKAIAHVRGGTEFGPIWLATALIELGTGMQSLFVGGVINKEMLEGIIQEFMQSAEFSQSDISPEQFQMLMHQMGEPLLKCVLYAVSTFLFCLALIASIIFIITKISRINKDKKYLIQNDVNPDDVHIDKKMLYAGIVVALISLGLGLFSYTKMGENIIEISDSLPDGQPTQIEQIEQIQQNIENGDYIVTTEPTEENGNASTDEIEKIEEIQERDGFHTLIFDDKYLNIPDYEGLEYQSYEYMISARNDKTYLSIMGSDIEIDDKAAIEAWEKSFYDDYPDYEKSTYVLRNVYKEPVPAVYGCLPDVDISDACFLVDVGEKHYLNIQVTTYDSVKTAEELAQKYIKPLKNIKVE